MTSLSEFMIDMRDSNTLVAVNEKQLREYVQICKDWEQVAAKQAKTIKMLNNKIDSLEVKITDLELKQDLEQIDLFA